MSLSETAARIEGLTVGFDTPDGHQPVVHGIDLTIGLGETVALVGESGSGKSVTSLAMMDLLARNARVSATHLEVAGVDVLRGPERERRSLRGNRVAMIFQDPLTYFDPLKTVGQQIGRPMRIHTSMRRSERRARVVELLKLVGIPDPAQRANSFPHQLSGGQRQRAMIAMALAGDPQLLIADEPTTALDVTIQAQVLDLLRKLVDERGMSLLLVSHDMGVIAGMADYVNVMYAGRIVERGPADAVFADPDHPYTCGLLESVLSTDADRVEVIPSIPGSPPRPGDLPDGCAFQPRCGLAEARCGDSVPPLTARPAGVEAACFLTGRSAVGTRQE